LTRRNRDLRRRFWFPSFDVQPLLLVGQDTPRGFHPFKGNFRLIIFGAFQRKHSPQRYHGKYQSNSYALSSQRRVADSARRMHARSPFGRSPRRRSPPTRWYASPGAVNTNYATTAFATHTFTVACRSWYLLGSGRGGRSQGYGHRWSEFVGSNLLQKPVYKKPGRSRDKVEPTGRRNEHRCGPTDRQ
jgi:hypothetical protein